MPEQSKEKWEGRGKQAGGKVQETAGEVIDDEEMEARGKAKQMEGKGEEKFGHAKERVKGAAKGVRDSVRGKR